MDRTFVDTSGFYAVADASDRRHAAASDVFVDLGTAGRLLSTDHVFVETWLLVKARLGRRAAIGFWDSMASGVVEVHGVTSRDLTRARRILDEWGDQDFSLVDCTSFAVMERLGIREALAVDRHFRLYRHGPGRSRAFRVVP